MRNMLYNLRYIRWNKKPLVVALILCLLLIFTVYRIIPHKPVSSPRTVVAKAFEATSKAESYCYHVKMKTLVNGEEEIYTDITGYREGKERIHIKGQIMKSDIEFYQVGDTGYTKEQSSGNWIKIENNKLNQDEIIAAELNPLVNLKYKELEEVTYDGIVEEGDDKVWKYTVKPIIDNPYLEILWEDFVYELLIDRSDGMLTKALLKAKSKKNPENKLFIDISFDEYGEDFDIKPPK